MLLVIPTVTDAHARCRSVFDINNISLIGTIASHLSYWDDEDCAHFMISQLLSRQRVVKR